MVFGLIERLVTPHGRAILAGKEERHDPALLASPTPTFWWR
jgi:hypothetical protein